MSIPNDMIEFLGRWQEKGRSYNLGKLCDCFDAFFTEFVIYNYLYNWLCAQDRAKYPYKGDRERAVKVPIECLGSDSIAEDMKIRNEATIIQRLLEEEVFLVRNARWDIDAARKLRSSRFRVSPRIWVLSMPY